MFISSNNNELEEKISLKDKYYESTGKCYKHRGKEFHSDCPDCMLSLKNKSKKRIITNKQTGY